MNGGNGRRVAYVNARLLDPASGLDGPGALLADGATIADLGPGLFAEGLPEDAVVECPQHPCNESACDLHRWDSPFPSI